jgi:hypothetical protein
MASSNNTYRNHTRPYPAIEEYAFIGDCHSVVLVSRAGSIDWTACPVSIAAAVLGVCSTGSAAALLNRAYSRRL